MADTSQPTSPTLMRVLDTLMSQRYQPDPVEEEWYASPDGLRSSARQLRAEADPDRAARRGCAL